MLICIASIRTSADTSTQTQLERWISIIVRQQYNGSSWNDPRSSAHTDSLWLANNSQEQFGQTNKEKITSKQQNESQSQTVLVLSAVWHRHLSRSMRRPSRSSRVGVYVDQAITRARSPYCSPLSLCTGKSLCPTAPARVPLYSPSLAPEVRAYQKRSFYRSLGGSAHILLCCRP